LKCPYIVDTGDSLQIWRKAVNITEKAVAESNLRAGQEANNYSLLQTSML
jgi:hypothetical protein